MEYIAEYMPKDTPGSLSDENYEALTAHLLRENGIALQQELRAAHAESIEIGFLPFVRKGD